MNELEDRMTNLASALKSTNDRINKLSSQLQLLKEMFVEHRNDTNIAHKT